MNKTSRLNGSRLRPFASSSDLGSHTGRWESLPTLKPSGSDVLSFRTPSQGSVSLGSSLTGSPGVSTAERADQETVTSMWKSLLDVTDSKILRCFIRGEGWTENLERYMDREIVNTGTTLIERSIYFWLNGQTAKRLVLFLKFDLLLVSVLFLL